MIKLQCQKSELNPEEYPEESDEFWQSVGGRKEKMRQWGGYCSRKISFNQRLYNLFPNCKLKILELGCGCGSFIKDCVNDGHLAIGLDGNKYFKDLGLHAWPDIPNNLLLCDVCKPFLLCDNEEIIKFDIITSWEFLEHIYEPDLPHLLNNIDLHSRSGTYWIFSANQRPHPPGHQCLHDKSWWIELFTKIGFTEVDLDFGNDVLHLESDSIIGYMQKQ